MIRKVFTFVLLIASAAVAFGAILRFNQGDDLLAQDVVPFANPQVPSEYQRKITCPLQKFEPYLETRAVDGAAMYVRDYRDSWSECLFHFMEDTDWGRDATATWTDSNFPHHKQFPSNFLAQPSVHGWRDCQGHLRNALETVSADALRTQLRERLRRETLVNVSAHGIAATLLCVLAFKLYHSSSGRNNRIMKFTAVSQ